MDHTTTTSSHPVSSKAKGAPVTPPYEYDHRPRTDKTSGTMIVYNTSRRLEPSSSALSSSNSSSSLTTSIAMDPSRPVHTVSMPSPPELLHDSEEEDGSLSPSSPSDHISSAVRSVRHRRKSVPHRSPSFVFHRSATVGRVTSYYEDENDDYDNSMISVLAALRQRVSMARSLKRKQSGFSAGFQHKRRQVLQIEIPRAPRCSRFIDTGASRHPVSPPLSPESVDEEESADDDERRYSEPFLLPDLHRKYMPSMSNHNSDMTDTTQSIKSNISSDDDEDMVEDGDDAHEDLVILNTARRAHAASGRPSRIKGPCQACQEASDGCMRKAFHWPFPSNQSFNDKGRHFVYLCNKCGLRYNKSGGCICRNCRWVFCKEEKRKALQHIEEMRRTRPDGRVYPDEDIQDFVCTPKYWTCGRPWKVGWVLNSQDDDDEISSTN